MKRFLKGFVIGIGKIIPGVSGALLAISLGVYDKCLECICDFWDNKKESIKYLFPIGLGIILSIIFFSRVISFCLDNFYFVTMLFFIGLIIGGIPSIYNKVNKKDYYVVILSFLFFFLLSISNNTGIYNMRYDFIDIIVFFVSGILEAIGTVVPGISSTALLMIMGTYNVIVDAIGNFNNFYILIPFVFGVVVGVIVCVKVTYFLINRCENKMYAFVLGILVASIVFLMVKSFNGGVNVFNFIVGVIMMIIGIFVGNIMEKK